jgi:hypothetical protein
MMGIEPNPQLFKATRHALPVFQPSGVDTIACAKDVTANDTFV